MSLLSYSEQDDDLFNGPVLVPNPPAHQAHRHPEHAQPQRPPMPGMELAPEQVVVEFDDVTLALRAEKVQVDETAVALLYDSGLYDISLKPSRRLVVRRGDERLHVVYAGGKVSLGQLILLSFIRTETPTPP